MTAVDIAIRNIDGQAEMRAVEELQKEVWGVPDLDVVPLTQLVAARAAGGSLIGAFDNNVLIGFAYGFAGFEHGRVTHHSHMLAVKPKYRSHSVGYRLKLAQRDLVLAQGIGEMTWTFDPLQSTNASFNFNRLGVVSNRYLIDFYGADAASFLHRNGTDRLWVTWPLASRRVFQRIDNQVSAAELEESQALVELGKNETPIYHDLAPTAASRTVFIEIPSRIAEVENTRPDLAIEWREVTRRAFTGAIADGFVIVDFIRGADTGRYLLCRTQTMKDLAA